MVSKKFIQRQQLIIEENTEVLFFQQVQILYVYGVVIVVRECSQRIVYSNVNYKRAHCIEESSGLFIVEIEECEKHIADQVIHAYFNFEIHPGEIEQAYYKRTYKLFSCGHVSLIDVLPEPENSLLNCFFQANNWFKAKNIFCFLYGENVVCACVVHAIFSYKRSITGSCQFIDSL